MPRSHDAIAPSDCLLAIGVPMDRDQFFRQIDDPRHDYARQVVSNCGGMATLAWQEYESVSRQIHRVAEQAAELGVAVVRSAGRAELCKAMAGGPAYTTILAHWKLSGLRPADMLDVEGWLRICRGEEIPEHPVHAALRRAYRNATSTPADATALAACIGPCVEAAHALLPARTMPGFVPLGEWSDLTRTALELALGPGLIQAARCVELADGLVSLPELAGCIPEDHDGVLDFLLCHSGLAYDTLHAMRPNVTVIMNRRPAVPGYRLLGYLATLKMLAREAQPILPLVERLHSRPGASRARKPMGGES